MSSIEWTNRTWNPLTGCKKISPGCKNCYAHRMSNRLKAMGQKKYENAFELTLHPEELKRPLKWKKPSTIFVNSMSDLFHKSVPDEFILQVFETMTVANWHQFQVLTKRSTRLSEISKKIDWPDNVWQGVSVENKNYVSRIDDLRNTNAVVKFLSLEPLLGPLKDLDLDGIDWVIVGGESGPKSRPMKEEWVIDIKNQCNVAKVPFFFKQWGGVQKSKTGRILEGQTWDEYPFIYRKNIEVKARNEIG